MTDRSTAGLLAILLLVGVACAPPRTDVSKGNLTMGAVQTHLENGKTTKAQVLE